MATLPNTWSILQAIQGIVQGTNAYKTVGIGAVKDWTDNWPVSEIAFADDDSEHYAHGGKIRDTQGFRVTSAVSFTQQTPAQAVQQLTTLRDTLIPLFQQHALLTGVAGVQDSRVKASSPKVYFLHIDSDDYAVHEFTVEVRTTYNVPIGASGI